MQSFRIVIHFNKLENFTPGIFCILKGAAFQQLRLNLLKKDSICALSYQLSASLMLCNIL